MKSKNKQMTDFFFKGEREKEKEKERKKNRRLNNSK